MKSSLLRVTIATGLLVIPVVLEIAIADLGDQTWSELTFAGCQLVGWLLLFTVCRRLGHRAPTRPARTGRAMVLAATLAQIAFALAYGGLVVLGVGPGGAFVLFALGFLLLTVGGLTWGISLVRHGRLLAGWGLAAAAGLGLLAIAVPVDPFHDIFLISSYLAWLPVGRGADAEVAGGRPVLSGASR